MTTIDWRTLRPHVPLAPGAPEFVERPGSAAAEIVDWIKASRSPLLVGGPAGVGKSTELSRAAALLQPARVACLVQLDRLENMRRLTPDRLFLRIAQRVGYIGHKILGLPLSAPLLNELGKTDRALQPETWLGDMEFTPKDLAALTLNEVARLSKKGRTTLLIDGLEKVPPGTQALEVFDALGELPTDTEQVVVVPWHLSFGPLAETVVRPGERFISVRAVDLEGEAGEVGRAFFRHLLHRRMGWEEVFEPLGEGVVADEARRLAAEERRVVDEAVRWSGGLPRTFLQIMADAGAYATLRRPEAEGWPNADDLADAVADQVDSFRRLLLPGDSVAIRAVAGTSGTELDLARKVRLMAHGVLLERSVGKHATLEPHPLARVVAEESVRRA